MFRPSLARLARPGQSAAQKAAKGKGSVQSKSPYRPDMQLGGDTPIGKKLIEILRPMPRPPPRTEEERARLRPLMIKYGKFMRKIHLIHMRKMNELLRAKAAAFDALPNYRRIEVIQAPMEPMPLNRPLFTHTPPIPAFNAGELTKRGS